MYPSTIKRPVGKFSDKNRQNLIRRLGAGGVPLFFRFRLLWWLFTRRARLLVDLLFSRALLWSEILGNWIYTTMTQFVRLLLLPLFWAFTAFSSLLRRPFGALFVISTWPSLFFLLWLFALPIVLVRASSRVAGILTNWFISAWMADKGRFEFICSGRRRRALN